MVKSLHGGQNLHLKDTELEKDWKFSHIGIVVKDLKKTIDYYQTMSIFEIPSQEVKVMEGKKVKIIGVHVFLGPLLIEVFQPVSGDSIHRGFLMNTERG